MERGRLSRPGKLTGLRLTGSARAVRSFLVVLGLAGALLACSGDPIVDAGDGGVTEQDSGPPADAGVRAKCPIPENNPTCTEAADCNTPGTKPSACDFCPGYNKQLCLLGTCAAPELTGFFTLRFDTAGLAVTTEFSFAGILLTAGTTGGETLTCDAVYAGQVDVQEPCYNVIDVRHVRATNGANGVYPVNFSNFASGEKVLFIVYAFDNRDAAGAPKGVSCTERVIQPGEAGPVDVEGDKMRILQ